MIKVTLKAKIFIQSALEAENKSFCLLSVLSGGCGGMQYSILLINELPTYKTIQITPTLYVDDMSYELLTDCTIDLQDDLGSKKLVVVNPLAKTSCSCGSSFSI